LLGLAYYYSTGIGPDDLYAPDEGYALYDGMVMRALEIDPDDAVSNAYLAWDYLQVGMDVESSARTAEKAFRAAPGNSEVLRSLCALARTHGKPLAAIALGRLSVARDPQCEDCQWVLYRAYLNAGQYAEAERAIRNFQAMSPGGWHSLGASLLAQGDAAAALEAFDQQQDDKISWLASRTTALYTLGRTEEYNETVMRILDEGAETDPLAVARMYAWAGDADNAFLWMDKAIDSGIRQVDVAQWDFHFKGLRDDPRWNTFWDEHWLTEAEFAAVELNIP
jgi:tetratricopeptide (TPR) repeat protein